MQETVNQLCIDHENLPQGLKVLNIGFGLGIVWLFLMHLDNLADRGSL